MNIKLWPASAENWFERIFSAVCIVGIGFLYLFMQLSAAQVFHNFFQQNVKAAPGVAHFFGVLFSLFTIGWGYGTATDKNYVAKDNVVNVLIIGASIVLSFCAYGGFNFSIG
jgi:hypothetical protein